MPARRPLLLNRDLSWLEFNQRVLCEASDGAVPLLERCFFLGVSAVNLDEFCMVRVGGLHLQVKGNLRRLDPSGLSPERALDRVRTRLRRLVRDQYACFRKGLLPALARHGVGLAPGCPPHADARAALDARFDREFFPVLTPVAVDAPDRFPPSVPLSLYLACRLRPRRGEKETLFEVMRLGPGLQRLIRLPGASPRFVWLEDLVRANIERFFPGREVLETVVFRVTRNADMPVDEEDAPDLLSAMARLLRKRDVSPCVRLEHEAGASRELIAWLRDRTGVAGEDVISVPGPVDLSCLRGLRELVVDPGLRYPSWTPQINADLDPGRDLFEQLAERDILLSQPYESFDPVQRLVEAAAADREVRAIKIALYRTSATGPVVEALRAAAQAGKHVTAIVELKARFDEARNIDWARSLERAGVQVAYGVRHLKTHAKVCLIVRGERDGFRYYTHFGTGNYNEVTARGYTDVGLLTSDRLLGRDAAAFFHAVTGYSEPQSYAQLVQAPSGLRRRLLDLIRFETDMALRGQPSRILAKMNALEDPETIEALYAASAAGVEIRLAVRGICCLRPGVKGLSGNIRVVGVVDRFLEHSRIFCFLHGGEECVFLSSADWMPRNLDRRVELLVPVHDPAARRKLTDLVEAALDDNVKGWTLRPDGSWERVRPPHGQRRLRSQEMLCGRALEAARAARRATATVFEPHLPRVREG
jgi:polyphosphate kinase